MDRPLEWRAHRIHALDQTVLPFDVRHLAITSVTELVSAIRRLVIRGAPLLGAAGALGVALAAYQAEREGWSAERLDQEIGRIREARPTAVNLAGGVDAVRPFVAAGPAATEEAALAEVGRITAANREIGERGAHHLSGSGSGPLRIHTHCNTGALACVEWGTGLGIIRSLHERGRLDHVIVDETRPLLQGSRLTCWELAELGIEHRVVCDGAGPFVIAQGWADAVVVGADRIAANGDVVNKVGTYGLALAAHEAGLPFVVAAPESTIDVSVPTGAAIPIESRSGQEVTHLAGAPVAREGTQALNLAFDVTPARLVTAIVTERRVITADAPISAGTGTR
ncbi:S-methyl-5-thioribose-1-phosphate isomerase [Actinoallomurus sp. NBC_01490]|uniref:S-methyl-5-thioribose-1-phosphate isomerase n=1 Tax=Actinoallomurus sp. NBC_01490 TaxID=2903557 RepID=UPI002E316B02|nr:S-methyl-5-thioribose-1-phosphate isomerase [Actinoallomurus sp. NBC_01490]